VIVNALCRVDVRAFAALLNGLGLYPGFCLQRLLAGFFGAERADMEMVAAKSTRSQPGCRFRRIGSTTSWAVERGYAENRLHPSVDPQELGLFEGTIPKAHETIRSRQGVAPIRPSSAIRLQQVILAPDQLQQKTVTVVSQT